MCTAAFHCSNVSEVQSTHIELANKPCTPENQKLQHLLKETPVSAYSRYSKECAFLVPSDKEFIIHTVKINGTVQMREERFVRLITQQARGGLLSHWRSWLKLHLQNSVQIDWSIRQTKQAFASALKTHAICLINGVLVYSFAFVPPISAWKDQV